MGNRCKAVARVSKLPRCRPWPKRQRSRYFFPYGLLRFRAAARILCTTGRAGRPEIIINVSYGGPQLCGCFAHCCRPPEVPVLPGLLVGSPVPRRVRVPNPPRNSRAPGRHRIEGPQWTAETPKGERASWFEFAFQKPLPQYFPHKSVAKRPRSRLSEGTQA